MRVKASSSGIAILVSGLDDLEARRRPSRNCRRRRSGRSPCTSSASAQIAEQVAQLGVALEGQRVLRSGRLSVIVATRPSSARLQRKWLGAIVLERPLAGLHRFASRLLSQPSLRRRRSTIAWPVIAPPPATQARRRRRRLPPARPGGLADCRAPASPRASSALRPVFATMLATARRSAAVSVKPGQTALTVTPALASSSASARVRPITRVLGRAIGRDIGVAGAGRRSGDIDDPPAAPRASCRRAPPVHQKDAGEVDASTRCHSASSVLRERRARRLAGIVDEDVDRPGAARARAKAAATVAASVTSKPSATSACARLGSSAATPRAARARRPASVTRAPVGASRAAIAAPMPPPAPVTSAWRPSSVAQPRRGHLTRRAAPRRARDWSRTAALPERYCFGQAIDLQPILRRFVQRPARVGQMRAGRSRTDRRDRPR